MAQPLNTRFRQPLHVLVVDDNIDQVDSLAYLVKDCGDQADYAINGTVALEMGAALNGFDGLLKKPVQFAEVAAALSRARAHYVAASASSAAR